MIVIVTGMPGSGKSTLVELLASEFKLKAVYASDILKQLKEKGITDVNAEQTKKSSGWWESREAGDYAEQRKKDFSMDRALDEKLLEIIETGDNLVVDSRTMPWLSKKGFKAWIGASEEVRAARIAERDGTDPEKVKGAMRKRAENDRAIYKELYGFDYGKDFSVFDLVLDTDDMDKQQVFEEVRDEIKNRVNS